MLKIRLSRGGSKKRPYYHIVIADAAAPRDGKFIAKVGSYNPMLAKDNAARVTLKVEAIADWLKKVLNRPTAWHASWPKKVW